MNKAQEFNQKIIAEFRANKGVVGGYFKNTPLLLLHSIGAKSGQARINPLAYLADDERYVIIASNAGRENHPSWYFNVKANPNVAVEVGTEKFEARASIAEEPVRTQLYDRMAAKNPGFEEYRQKTERVIPVIILNWV
jgi:deazaflavin-dependent oxidoreductase (nitroreductase family)